MSAPQPAFIVRRLIDLAGNERELLITESWEQALAVREQIDELFAQLQAAAQRAPLSPALRNDLMRLHALQAENQRLMQSLKAKAGSALAEMTKVSQISGYAPLGSNHKPSPRYLDHSA